MTSHTRTRLSPDARRSQLLDLGVRLLATRSIEEISIDLLAEEAGISRGLLYHYFGNKVAFREAVVRRAAEELVASAVPPPGGDPLARLHAGVAAYVDYVVANYEGYLSLVRGAKSGDPTLREIYDSANAALTERILGEDEGLLPTTPTARLLVRGWQAMTEELVLTWVVSPEGVTRDELVDLMVGALPALFGISPD